MSTRIITTMITDCDFCGITGDAVKTFPLGDDREIDLCGAHGRPVEPESGSEANGSQETPESHTEAQSGNGHALVTNGKRADTAEIRDWARKSRKYKDLSAYGKLPQKVIDDYDKAHTADAILNPFPQASIPAANGSS
jgi:hypothetical protein